MKVGVADQLPVNGRTAAADGAATTVAIEQDRQPGGDTAGRRPEPSTESIPAYELYLIGSDPRRLRSDAAAQEGLEHFERAIELDPGFAAAYAGATSMHLRLAQGSRAQQRAALAEAAALKVIALDDSLAEPHRVLGNARWPIFDFGSAEIHLLRSVELDPTSAPAHEAVASFYAWLGRAEEALAAANRAVAIDPLSPTANFEVARSLLGAPGNGAGLLLPLREGLADEIPMTRSRNPSRIPSHPPILLTTAAHSRTLPEGPNPTRKNVWISYPSGSAGRPRRASRQSLQHHRCPRDGGPRGRRGSRDHSAIR